ncbi:hypothetical protein AVU99_gp035 [Mycobacterium phage Lolly9]|uniref:Uncharacterized protein n=1 Tax=Mycobacterium phage Lolly9 TaxID=1698711 RepID=A0A0K2FNT8_9CAUD|nr:hypothetical protein AVU99_gp035 [Mycobacterium phage Lolly9]ALA48453.1 hypothetical protein LOLLY9_35 [Mycobacterium phage Lolly9]QOP65764.1 membrane protein [Mycobacterium phage MiniLon]
MTRFTDDFLRELDAQITRERQAMINAAQSQRREYERMVQSYAKNREEFRRTVMGIPPSYLLERERGLTPPRPRPRPPVLEERGPRIKPPARRKRPKGMSLLIGGTVAVVLLTLLVLYIAQSLTNPLH